MSRMIDTRKEALQLLNNIWYDDYSAVMLHRGDAGYDIAILDISFGLGTALRHLSKTDPNAVPEDAEVLINEIGHFVLDAIKEKIARQNAKP